MYIGDKVTMLEDEIKKGDFPSLSDFLRIEAEVQEADDQQLLKRVVLSIIPKRLCLTLPMILSLLQKQRNLQHMQTL